jgi:hypothetical protein
VILLVLAFNVIMFTLAEVPLVGLVFDPNGTERVVVRGNRRRAAGDLVQDLREAAGVDTPAPSRGRVRGEQ